MDERTRGRRGRRPIILTTAWLRRHDACPAQVVAFRRLFGAEALVCPETLDMGSTAGLSVGWLGGSVLTEAALAALLADPANWQPDILAELTRSV